MVWIEWGGYGGTTCVESWLRPDGAEAQGSGAIGGEAVPPPGAARRQGRRSGADATDTATGWWMMGTPPRCRVHDVTAEREDDSD